MSEIIKAQVEDWLDKHWDSLNDREVGTDTYNEKRWLTKVVDAGYATPTWPKKWHGLDLSARETRVIEKAFQRRGAKGWGRDRFHLGAITIFKLGSNALKKELLYVLLTGPFACPS